MTSETSPRLGLDYVMPAQAQKHVTVNETVRKLDALVQAAALSRSVDDQPAEPNDGDAYILTPARSGADWGLMSANSLAVFRDAEWTEIPPVLGMRLWVFDEVQILVFDGTSWIKLSDSIHALQNLDFLGIGTVADSANPLSAKLNAALWTALETGAGGSGDLRYTLNKEATANVVSLLFQTGYSARAEIGLIGDDVLSIKTTADGVNWRESLRADPDRVVIDTVEGLDVVAINAQSPGTPRNLVINGDFVIAQRGAEFLAPVPGDYLLDRWKFISASGMSCEFSQEEFAPGQTAVPGEPLHFLQWRLTGTATGNPWIEHRIEDVRRIPEGAAVLSLYAKASRTVSLTARVRRNYGAGGSATEELERQTLAISTDWQRYEIALSAPSLSGKTLGESHHISIEIYLASGETSVEIDFADVQLERGRIATVFDRRAPSETLKACQRYFAKTYPVNVVPGTSTNDGALTSLTNAPSNTALIEWRLPVEMRTTPNAEYYSPASGATGLLDAGGTDISVATLSNASTAITCQSGAHTGTEIARLQMAADAEL